jgi:phosphohistidine phosphatase
VVNAIPEEVTNAMLVGHNPDISYFVDYLTKQDTGGSMKKATVIHLQFDGFTWAEISQNLGTFVSRIDGKKL